jgi:hypothetical protein
MAYDIKTVEVPPGPSSPTTVVPYLAKQDRVMLSNFSVPNAAGGSAGAAVTVAILMQLPAKYTVLVNPDQDATAYVAQSSKSTSGFTITLNPRLSANTLAAGVLDVTVLA